MTESDVPSPIELLRDVTGDRIVARASAAAFGKPLVTNVLRAMLVEAIVAEALLSRWMWCSADYANWDFQSEDGVRLEVKQSAARQSWSTDASPPSRASFDIAARIRRWDGTTWVEDQRRHADIYVLAHHPLIGAEADHRNPRQWRFYVLPTALLPNTKTIALSAVRALARIGGLEAAPDVGFEELAARVEGVTKAALLIP